MREIFCAFKWKNKKPCMCYSHGHVTYDQSVHIPQTCLCKVCMCKVIDEHFPVCWHVYKFWCKSYMTFVIPSWSGKVQLSLCIWKSFRCVFVPWWRWDAKPTSWSSSSDVFCTCHILISFLHLLGIYSLYPHYWGLYYFCCYSWYQLYVLMNLMPVISRIHCGPKNRTIFKVCNCCIWWCRKPFSISNCSALYQE